MVISRAHVWVTTRRIPPDEGPHKNIISMEFDIIGPGSEAYNEQRSESASRVGWLGSRFCRSTASNTLSPEDGAALLLVSRDLEEGPTKSKLRPLLNNAFENIGRFVNSRQEAKQNQSGEFACEATNEGERATRNASSFKGRTRKFERIGIERWRRDQIGWQAFVLARSLRRRPPVCSRRERGGCSRRPAALSLPSLPRTLSVSRSYMPAPGVASKL